MEKEFDEDEAIAFMKSKVAGASKYDDDQLLNLLDIIWDYYDDNGFLDISFDGDDTEANPTEITAHARKLLAKDKGNEIDLSLVEELVRAEMEYEKSLEE